MSETNRAAMSETAVERRLRGMSAGGGDNCGRGCGWTHDESVAIDLGRKAIALLNATDFLSTAWYQRRAALLARCEGSR